MTGVLQFIERNQRQAEVPLKHPPPAVGRGTDEHERGILLGHEVVAAAGGVEPTINQAAS
ncbi:hypothetical protein D3C83_177780 [compost metagenome]